MKKLLFPLMFLGMLVFIWSCNSEPDNTPPRVSISYPQAETTVRDTVQITALASDNQGIKDVEFFVDNISLGKVYSAPYKIVWDTKAFSNTVHTVWCKATDKSNNTAESQKVNVLVANYLFKATFTNYWLHAGEEALLFLSDEDGNLLAEKLFSGNTTFEINEGDVLNKKKLSSLRWISVTVVKHDGIVTNMNVPLGSWWTWKGRYSPKDSNPLSVTLDFKNCPTHNGFVVSSLWSHFSSTTGYLTFPYTYHYYVSPMDLYVMLNTESGKMYKWITNISHGTTLQDDFSTMISTKSRTVTLSDCPYGYKFYLYGFTHRGYHYEGNYLLDTDHDYNTNLTALQVHYPNSDFDDYRTSIYVYTDQNRHSLYYQAVYGDIPTSFRKIGADFEIVNSSFTNFEVTTSGSFLETRSLWQGKIFWQVYSDNQTTKYSLPQLPSSAYNNFGIRNEDYSLYWVDLLDYPELNSYSDILYHTFYASHFFFDDVHVFRARLKYFNAGSLLKGKAEKKAPYENHLPNN